VTSQFALQYWAVPVQRFYRGRYDPGGRPIRGGITVVAREAELLAVTLKTGIIRKMAGIVFAVTMCAFVFSGSPTAAVGRRRPGGDLQIAFADKLTHIDR
jgi:hypothetical protein